MDEVHVGGKDFPKKEVLNSFFSYAANCARPLEDVLDERLAQINVDPSDILRVHEAYSRMKVDLGIMDFDDLLVNGLRLLEENPDVLADYRRQFLHVLVDEYQDTNVIQSRFVDLLAGEGGNLMAVGDDFQCIYTWRGADVNNILGFEKRHPGARVIKIERNYRSTPQILALANACVAASHNQFAKVLKATRPGGDRPWRVSVRDGTEQGRAVMSIIRNEIAAGRAPGDIAILYRAHFQSIELQMELGRAGIPHTVTSGTGVFEQAHVKDMLSLLRLVSNPADRLAFDRLMSLLPGIGQKSADAIWAKLGGACTLATPEGREALLKLLKPAARGAWTGVSDAIADYFEEGGRIRGNVVELVHAFVEGYYGLYLRKKYEDYADRADDVNEVAQQVAESGSLENFLQEVALITNAEAAYEGAQDLRSQTVRLSTIHQAKGLEWPVVILLWAVEGMFPSSRSLGENQDDSEERRLFYVAVTRARNELAIFTPEWRKSYDGGIYPCRPSRFVTEIPPDCLQLRYGFGW